MKILAILIILILSALKPAKVYGSEMYVKGDGAYTAGVQVYCEAKDKGEVTPTPTQAPTKTLTPIPTPAIEKPDEKKSGSSEELPWWFKFLRIADNTKEKITEKITEKIIEREKSNQPGGTYYTTATSEKKSTAEPANLAKISYETTRANTGTSKKTATSTVSRVNTAPVPTPVIEDKKEEELKDQIDYRRMHEAWDRIRALKTPHEFYKNPITPIKNMQPETEREALVIEEVEPEEIQEVAPDVKEEEIVEIKEEKKELFTPFVVRLIWIGSVALLLIVLLILSGIFHLLYRIKNALSRKRPEIYGVLTDVDQPFVKIVNENRSRDYELMQSQIAGCERDGFSREEMFNRFKESGFKTLLPLGTLMSIQTGGADDGKCRDNLYPSDAALKEAVCTEKDFSVKVTFYCKKAHFEESLRFAAPKERKEDVQNRDDG